MHGGAVRPPWRVLIHLLIVDYPSPLWSVRDREALYGDIGHTIMDLLAVSLWILGRENIMLRHILCTCYRKDLSCMTEMTINAAP